MAARRACLPGCSQSPPKVDNAQKVNIERKFFIDNLLVRIHLIIEMIWWAGLAPWEPEFHFPGSRISTFHLKGGEISEFVTSFISWELITGVIRLKTFRADTVSARALGIISARRTICAESRQHPESQHIPESQHL